MEYKEKLLSRLEKIGLSLQKTKKAKALMSFGSVGVETDRIDEYSDLDFLVVAKNNCKQDLIENMEWLSSVAPISYCHKNTQDGFKLFFSDGIYSEFGILKEDEVKNIPHAEGRVIWCEDGFNHELRMPTKECDYEKIDLTWHLGEIVTNLYVGLCRYARNEKLSAVRFIQGSALDHLLLCSKMISQEEPCYKDVFQNERRYERRYPKLAKYLPEMIQGYEKCPQAALSILKVTETYFEVNPFIKKQIINLANQIMSGQKNS